MRARFTANVAALEMLAALRSADRPATADEQAVLARWSGWGATGLASLFDEGRAEHAADRARLRGLLSPQEYLAAQRTSINAHYTDAVVVQAVWGAVTRLGLTSGRVLEPGCGSGTFLGFAPAGVALTGVELDPTTARVAAALYPDASVRTESFADTKIPAGFFDGVVGNVPFANVVLHDPLHNPGRHAMHNHFIIKSLELTRSSGVVAVLTSRWTLDAVDGSARRELSALADLVGAVRLPSGALRRSAGTEAVTDLLILRRREPGRTPHRPERWASTTPMLLPGPGGVEEPVEVNRYFSEHPERVLGEFALRIGMYGVAGLEVDGPVADGLATPLAAALAAVAADAHRAGLVVSARPDDDPWSGPVRFAAAGLPDGHLAALGPDQFSVIEEGVHQPLRVPRTQHAELGHLLQLRDLARALIDTEAVTEADTSELGQLRAALGSRYAAYVAEFGPINRYTLRPTGRVGDDGVPVTARVIPPAVRTLMRDPSGPLVAALEVFDEETQQAGPAGLLRGRQVLPRQPVDRVEAVEDAVAVCLDRCGRVDLAVVGQLLGCGADAARDRLVAGGLVFEVPGAATWETRPAYLSGNVREKLEQARLAAVDDPQRWRRNVEALRGVLPADLGPAAITVRVGAVWIPPEDYTAFLQQLTGDRRAQVMHYGGGTWEVTGGKYGIRACHEWGTEELAAGPLLSRMLSQQRVEVYDTYPDKTRVLNPTRTEAAKEKAQLIQDRFAEWVWEDPERAARLVARYNETFNSIVLRDYTTEGTHLSLPGLASTFTPRPHQRAAVARIINEPNTGLFHAVGAGKTAEMVMGAMELKRLGLVRKPCVVVPNNMLEQFTREWQQLYPQARLLAAYPDDVTSERRRRFVARVATNDWDAVVMTRTTFQRLSLSPEHQAGYLGRELARIREQLELAAARPEARSATVKQMEKNLLRREEQLKELLDTPTDPGVTFEASGIDLLIVDELHDYKNLATASNIRDAAIAGSQRASDLHMKIDYLREQHGGRAIVAATATPIANSITEMWVLQRYLDPDSLHAAGLDTFDQWAATFGEIVSELELSVAGGSTFKLRDRFARFGNVPALLTMLHLFGDFKTAEDLKLPVPLVAERHDGKRLPRIVTIAPTPDLQAFIAELGDRADKVATRAVRPEEDNMLKISSDGRKAGLDLRLVDPHALVAGHTKVDTVADLVARTWRQTKDNVYRDVVTGEESPVRGALQLVFCDLGTPSDRWNVYDALRDALYERGLPDGSVRFAHEARNDAEKGRLFAACRSGHVAVLVGSTQKMGVGTNVQARAVHLVDVDAPWRPADVEQRHGRIIRQGNQNPEVQITQVVTERSFDAYMWQTLETKAKFIDQVLSGRVTGVHEIEEIGSDVLSFAEVKALSSGNPLLLAKAQASQELAKYQRLKNAWVATQRSLAGTVSLSRRDLDRTRELIPVMEAAAARVTDTRGDAFTATVDGRRCDSRADASVALEHLLRPGLSPTYPFRFGEVATLGGHTLVAHHDTTTLFLTVPDAPRVGSNIPLKDLGAPLDTGIIVRLENVVRSIPDVTARLHVEEQVLIDRIEQAERASTVPFAHDAALATAEARYDQVTREIAATTERQPAIGPHPASDRTDAPPPPAIPRVDSPAPTEADTVPWEIVGEEPPGNGAAARPSQGPGSRPAAWEWVDGPPPRQPDPVTPDAGLPGRPLSR